MQSIKLDNSIKFNDYTRKYKIERWKNGRVNVTVSDNRTMSLRVYENIQPRSMMRFTSVMGIHCNDVTFHACESSLSVWMYAK